MNDVIATPAPARGSLSVSTAPPSLDEWEEALPMFTAAPGEAAPAALVLPIRNRGPVVRKVVDAFYFAAKAHALIQSNLGSGDLPDKSLPDKSSWTVLKEKDLAEGQPLEAGVLSAWYPEVGTLVLAYAAGARLEESQKHLPVKMVDPHWSSPFYLPNGWGAGGFHPFVEALNLIYTGTKDGGATTLKAEATAGLAKANNWLRAQSGEAHPLRILVTGFSGGGALASLAAPWIALAYPSADSRLVTFGTPGIRTSDMMRLTEWTVGVRLPVVIDRDDVTETHLQDSPTGIALPRITLTIPPDSPLSDSRHSLAAYLVGLSRRIHDGAEISTTGTPYVEDQFCPGSFWGRRDFANDILSGAKLVALSHTADAAENVAMQWANGVNLRGDLGGMGTLASVQAPESLEDPGFVHAPFRLIPGNWTGRSMDELIKELAVRISLQPGRYAQAAYSSGVSTREFVEATQWPPPDGGRVTLPEGALPGSNVALVSDDLSGADVYVAWHEASGTLLFDFRGTEDLKDWITDFEFYQAAGRLVERRPGDTGIEAVDGMDTGRVHRGFLEQFRAVTGQQSYNFRDLIWPPSIFAAIRTVRTAVHLNLSRNAPPPNAVHLAAVAAGMMGNRTPLRVLCYGHSLGGALATIGAWWSAITYSEADVRCVTFGSPKVGDAEFVKACRQVVGTRIRVVNGEDLAPSLPPWRYDHIFPAIWLRPGLTEAARPTVELHDTILERPPVFSLNKFTFVRNAPDHSMHSGYNGNLQMVLQDINDSENEQVAL